MLNREAIFNKCVFRKMTQLDITCTRKVKSLMTRKPVQKFSSWLDRRCCGPDSDVGCEYGLEFTRNMKFAAIKVLCCRLESSANIPRVLELHKDTLVCFKTALMV